MYVSTYQGAAAMAALEKWQAAISQNLANVSVAGYKRADVAFASEPLNGTDEARSVFSEQLQAQMIKPEMTASLQAGQLIPSDSPTDVAIKGDGFFSYDNETGQRVFSRDGQFHLNADNVLVNKNGFPIRGQQGQIQFVPGAGQPLIDRTGRIFQGTTPVDQIEVVNFGDASKLQRISGGFVVPQDSQIRPEVVDNPDILQGFIEGSNVSPTQEMVNLILVSRAYEANQKVITTADDIAGKAVQTLGQVS